MALTAAWNGALASYPGAITKQEKVSRALGLVVQSHGQWGARYENIAPAMPFL